MGRATRGGLNAPALPGEGSGQWEGLTLAGAARDVAMGDRDGVAGAEVLILGEQAEIVSLRELVLRRHMGLR